MNAIRWFALVLAAAALWFAWQAAIELFLAWYSGVEWESPQAPWFVGAEAAVLAIGGVAALAYALVPRRAEPGNGTP